MAKCVNISSPEFKFLEAGLETDTLTLATEVSLWQDKNNTDEFPGIEDITSLLGNRTEPSEQEIKESRNAYGRRASRATIVGLAKKINGVFPSTKLFTLTTEEIVKQFGSNYSASKGFTRGNHVYINTDLATLDTPIHEYGHIFIQQLRFEGTFKSEETKDLYRSIISKSLEHPIKSKIANLYPELSEEELGEEIFVTLLGLNSQDKLTIDSWYDKNIKPLVDKFKGFVNDFFHQIFGYSTTGNDVLDFGLDDTLSDIISKVGDGLLGKSKLRDIGVTQDVFSIIEDLKRTRFSKIEVKTTSDLINVLVGEDPEGVTDFEAFAKNIVLQSKVGSVGGKKLKGYIGLNGKFIPYENQVDQKDQIEQVKRERIGEIDLSKRNLGKNIITYFEKGNEGGDFNEEGNYISAIEQIINPYEKGKVKMKLLSELSGFEENTDIILVELGGDKFDLIAVSGSNLNQKFKLDKGTNILGDFITNYQAKYLTNPISLEANRKDVKLLRLGLLGMKLKEGNPKATFNRLLAQNFTFNAKNIPYSIDFAKLLPQIKEIKNNPAISPIIGKNLSFLENEELYNPEIYQQDYINSYQEFIISKLASNVFSKGEKGLVGAIEEYKKDANIKDDLIKSFEERLVNLQNSARRVGIDRDTLEKDPEYILISQAILQLRNADISLRNDLNSFRKLVDSGNMTARPLIDIVVTETKNVLNNIRQVFVGDYKAKSRKMIEGLISDYNSKFGGMGVVSDYTIGDTTRYFEPLYETIEAIDIEGNKVEVKNGFLKRKGSEGYNNLTQVQKEFIDWTNKHIKEQYKNTLTTEEFAYFDEKWKDGMLPLVKASFTNQFYKGNYQLAISRYFNRFTNYNDMFESDLINDLTTLPNNFKNQLGEGIYGSQFRQNLIGLTDDNKLINKEANDNIETNLEVILDLFTMNSLRKKELDKMLPLYSSARAVLSFQEHNLFNRTSQTRNYIDLYIQKVIFNANKSTKDLEVVDKVIDNTTAATSLMLLGYNLVQPVTNFFTGLFTNISAFTSNMFGNNNMFGVKEWGLAVGKISNPANIELNNEIMYTYGMTNMDYESLLGSRFKTTDRTIFKTRSAFWLNTAGDYINRMHIFIAQSIKDGTYSAHKIVDDKLVYNEDLDRRFIGEEGQALKRALKEELSKEPGGLDSDGRMLRAYPNRLRNKYKQFADSIHGAYDRETQSNLQIFSIGRMLSHMRKYLIGKYERLYKEGHINETLGNYKFIKDPSTGETIAVWEGRYIEGVIQTMQVVAYNLSRLKASERKTLNASQKENIGKLLSDSIYFGLITAIMGMLFDDEDESEIGKKYKRSLNNAVGDLLATYSPVTYIGSFSTNPIVSLSYATRVLELSGKLITLDFKGFEKGAARNLFIYRDVKTISDIINNK